MNLYYKEGNVALYNDDSLKILNEFEENSVDLVFADPPYFLE